MNATDIMFLLVFITSLSACTGKQNDKTPASTDISQCIEDRHTVYSDDSLVVAYSRDTGEGGTAPDIETVCRFQTESGGIGEEKRPLLRIAHPNEDYGHHEVKKIVSLDNEYGRRLYFFYLSAKVGSNEYAHDIAAFCIDGDSLRPVNVFLVGDKNVSHICIDGLCKENPTVNSDITDTETR